MAGRIKKCNFFIIPYNLISADMLCNPPGLAERYVCLTDIIEKCCFPMINMPQNDNDRMARERLLWFVLFFLHVYQKYFRTCSRVYLKTPFWLRQLIFDCHSEFLLNVFPKRFIVHSFVS